MEFTKSLKVGVIGLGVGEAHIKSYKKIRNVDVVSICDLNTNRLNEIKKKYEVPNIVKNYKEITENKEIDVVSICSYDNYHAEQIISCLKNGKHVMVEKPAVLHPFEAEDVIKEIENSKLFITSNLILRKSPRFIKLKQMIENKEFGEIFHIEGDYWHYILHKITKGWRGEMDFYCTVYGGGIHLIDLMRWLLQDEIEEVFAMGSSIPTNLSKYQWVDTITSIMKYKNGATSKSTTSFAPIRNKFHSLNIYGTKKTFINELPNGKIFNEAGDNVCHTDFKELYPGTEKGDMLPEFIECIRLGKKPLVNEIDIFRVMSVCFAIWESIQSKKIVKPNNLI